MTPQKFNWSTILSDAAQIQHSVFMKEILDRREEYGAKSTMSPFDCSFIYALTRWGKPKVIVESGGFYGMSDNL